MFNKLKDLLKKRNVIGFCNQENKVTVFVTKKLSMAKINKEIENPESPWEKEDVVPKKLRPSFLEREKETEVIEIGEVKAFIDSNTYRPVKGGMEIGPQGMNWSGTAGAVIKFKKYKDLPLLGQWNSLCEILRYFGLKVEDKFGLITNSHVVHWDVTKAQDPQIIVQPSRTKDVIGKSVYTEKMNKKGRNEYDVAIIELDDKISFLTEIINIGNLKGFKDGVKGEKVQKYGRTTKLMEGELLYKNVQINVNYGDWLLLSMVGLDMYSKISAPGDSGSLIVSKEDNKAVSLLFAGNNTTTFGIPICKIIDKLKIEII